MREKGREVEEVDEEEEVVGFGRDEAVADDVEVDEMICSECDCEREKSLVDESKHSPV